MTGRGDSSGGRSLWDAVDKLAAPTQQKVDRQVAGAWSEGLTFLEELATQDGGACDVRSFRSASVVWATIPSLWDQATLALYGSGGEAGSGSKPLRERSVADLNLLEIRTQVIDACRWQQELRGETVPDGDFTVAELRHTASLIRDKPPARIVDLAKRRHANGEDEFAQRLESWARAIETYLQAGEHEARSVRLRDQTCPTCRTAQITIDKAGNIAPFDPAEDHHRTDNGQEVRQVASALVIRFRDGKLRGVQCDYCGDTWFAGDALEDLARQLGIGMFATVEDERLGA